MVMIAGADLLAVARRENSVSFRTPICSSTQSEKRAAGLDGLFSARIGRRGMFLLFFADFGGCLVSGRSSGTIFARP